MGVNLSRPVLCCIFVCFIFACVGCSLSEHNWTARELAGTYHTRYRTGDGRLVIGTLLMSRNGTYKQAFTIDDKIWVRNAGTWHLVDRGSCVSWDAMLWPADDSGKPSFPTTRTQFLTPPELFLGRITIGIVEGVAYRKE